MGQVGLFLLLILLLAPSSEGVVLWFDPFDLADKADWWFALDYLNVLLGCVISQLL